MLYSKLSLVISFIHNTVYMSIPISRFIPPPPSLYLPHLLKIASKVSFTTIGLFYSAFMTRIVTLFGPESVYGGRNWGRDTEIR